jgi:hypothetical protein
MAAKIKNPTSRTKLRRATWKGLARAIEPATTAVMKHAAPISSPMAKLPLLELIAANVEKTSGLPFPKAKKVTPVKLSLIPRMLAIVLRLIQRKSLAAIPIVLKRSDSHAMMMLNAIGCTWRSEQ